ncbi:MAG TPA: phenylalanine--tRNA ligase subunit beta [Balneolales bacterium]|nr:phenylalanine--tRNA ligase subunit beta [Balneolales bacterium]
MKISYNWLKDYIDLDITPREVADKLTYAGLEVEEIEHIGSKLEGVIVGKVLTCVDHPNADRLKLCKVDLGDKVRQIVCGAPNVAAGQTVPVATVGTELPVELDNGKKLVLRKAKIRGQVSEGMICAEDELGLSENHEGIMVLDDNLKTGTPFSEVQDLYEDYIFEIALTPNRPDATSHYGVARDLSAVLDKPLKQIPEKGSKNNGDIGKRISIEVKSPEKCHRYVGKIIENITVKESPQWLKNKLMAIGLRPINNIVDATNFVLHEMGQPLHAFDYNLLSDKKIIVQDYDKDVRFTTLDDVEHTVPAGSLFICDGQKPVALAGVMGGQNSEINNETTTVLLESAYFEPVGIRKTSKRLGLQTDASYRFERGIDPNITLKAANRCANLIARLGDGIIVKGTIDVHPVQTKPIVLDLRVSFVNKLLGTKFDRALIKNILNRLEIDVEAKNDDVLKCTVPTFRPDIEREVDLVEEVARIYDYNKIPAPEFVRYITPSPVPYHETFLNKVKESVKSLGFKEIYSNSLMPEQASRKFADEKEIISTLNPISKDQTDLRPSLAYGFLRSVAYNFNRSALSVRFFEVGHVFRKGGKGTIIKGIDEETHLLMGLSGQKHFEHWKEENASYTVFDLKSAVNGFFELLGLDDKIRSKKINDNRLAYYIGKIKLGNLYRAEESLVKSFDIDESVFIAEFSLTAIEKLLEKQPPLVYEEIPKYPSFEYDIALVVDKTVSAGNIMDDIRKNAGSLLLRIDIFDVYEGKSIGENKKSIAFRLSFRDKSKTLTISNVEPIINKILKILNKNYSANLRS